MNLSILSARYVAPLKVELHFNDDTVKTIDVGAFIRNHPHPQYNSYLNENKFKKFKIEFGNIVLGKNWDLIFPIDKLLFYYVMKDCATFFFQFCHFLHIQTCLYTFFA